MVATVGFKVYAAKEIVMRLRHTLLMLRHNWLAHPLAGLLYLLQCEKAGDWIHDHL